jgi:Predicted pyrophosphatase
MEEKTLNEIQNEIDTWANQFTKPYFEPLSRMAALTEEVGEVARVLNLMYGDKKRKDGELLKDLEEEIGDLLFSMVCMANAEKINLTEAYKRRMDKAVKRDNNYFEKNDSNE